MSQDLSGNCAGGDVHLILVDVCGWPCGHSRSDHQKLQMEIFGIRILAVLMTWEVQVAIVLLQVMVTLIEDNDLQVWCRQCVFGTQPPDKRWNEQRKALESAFREIL